MRRVPESKKHQYWNHFVARWVVERLGGGHGVTGPRLRKVKFTIWQDNFFWADVILRHGGDSQTPEVMEQNDPETYGHCLGNFWGMVYQSIFE